MKWPRKSVYLHQGNLKRTGDSISEDIDQTCIPSLRHAVLGRIRTFAEMITMTAIDPGSVQRILMVPNPKRSYRQKAILQRIDYTYATFYRSVWFYEAILYLAEHF